MSGWTAEAAEARYLDDLELEETARELVADRLQAEPEDARQAAYFAAARRWFDRGQAQVALALLDRATIAPLRGPGASHDARTELPIGAMMAQVPGVGGLPALTEAEAAALREAESPDEALAIVAGARRRLEAHGVEARRLLQRYLERQRVNGGDGPR